MPSSLDATKLAPFSLDEMKKLALSSLIKIVQVVSVSATQPPVGSKHHEHVSAVWHVAADPVSELQETHVVVQPQPGAFSHAVSPTKSEQLLMYATFPASSKALER